MTSRGLPSPEAQTTRWRHRRAARHDGHLTGGGGVHLPAARRARGKSTRQARRRRRSTSAESAQHLPALPSTSSNAQTHARSRRRPRGERGRTATIARARERRERPGRDEHTWCLRLCCQRPRSLWAGRRDVTPARSRLSPHHCPHSRGAEGSVRCRRDRDRARTLRPRPTSRRRASGAKPRSSSARGHRLPRRSSWQYCRNEDLDSRDSIAHTFRGRDQGDARVITVRRLLSVHTGERREDRRLRRNARWSAGRRHARPGKAELDDPWARRGADRGGVARPRSGRSPRV